MLDPRLEYSNRLEAHLKTVSAKDRLHIKIGNLKVIVVAGSLLIAYLSLSKNLLPAYWLLVLIAALAVLALAHELIVRAKTRASGAADYYRKGIARIEDRWPGTGQGGDRFRADDHVYAEDLDIFGRGSLFELLSTARLPMGEHRLADWLSRPSPKSVILARQELVSELRQKLDLRENLAITGEKLRPRLDPESLVGWAEHASDLPGNVWRGVVVALAIAAVASAVYCYLTLVAWPVILVLMIEGFLRWQLLRKAKAVIDGVSCNAEGLLLFSNILELLEREPFISPQLQKLCTPLKEHLKPSSEVIRRLAGIAYWIDARHSLLAGLAELPLLYTLQIGFAAEAWRRRWGGAMRTWVNTAAEIEALLSLGTYSFEHPADRFPEFVEGSSVFDGENLGHPLIPDAKCVRNSVRLDEDTRVMLVSGSNMSGKSTLLRTIGINAVLAMAGAPIRGKSLRLSPLIIGTSIRRTDSLQQGRSGFYTEILHIRRVFNLTKELTPVLFLFDELLEGTNSKDRRIGSAGLLKALLNCRAIGVVTTHDLALTEITDSANGFVRNMHFQDQVKDGKMYFDYKLREGVVVNSNALELMRLMGFEI
ncbi:MAG: mismatch repair protein [Acidobacteria bacterium]|nr:MAG: mismatch repair protein [Acidobacteriota bacterium]